jgi:hypothetical protein
MKRFLLPLLSLLTSCSAQFVNGGSNTGIPNLNPGWTYVQTMTTGANCASTTCSLTQFAPTVAGSVWIVATANSANISPSSISLGGGTWVKCTPCHGFTPGYWSSDIFYNLGGTAGTTTLDVNYSSAPSATSLMQFIEISPPIGSTASFDTGGYNASASCTTTCNGVALTLAGNDAIIMPSNLVGNWSGWNFLTGGAGYEWFADWLGDGLCLNCTVGTAPGANMSSTPEPGFLGAEIAFKSTSGSFTSPTPVFNFANITSPPGASEYNCSPTCSITIPSTTAGNLLFIEASTEVSNDYISSISGGGTWVVPTMGCQEQITSPATLNVSCAYTLSATGSTTSLSITMAGSSSATGIAIYEVHRTSGSWVLDTDGATANAASFTPTLQPLTLSGTNDVVFQAMGDTGGIETCQFYPYYVFNQPLNTNTSNFALLNTPGVPSTPVCYNPQNSASIVHGVAFK